MKAIYQEASEGKLLKNGNLFCRAVWRDENDTDWQEVDDIGQLNPAEYE